MYPLVLIKSFGNEKCADIIEELLRINGDSVVEPMSICFDTINVNAHKLCISTKYYKNEVLLFECCDINSLTKAVKSKIEGAIFYFDSNNLHFLSELDNLIKFVKDNDIGVSTLITRNLNEKSLHGLTYDKVKSKCKFDLNVIDLCVNINNEEPAGFAEVLELLKNHLWSNVNITSLSSNTTVKPEEYDDTVEDALNEFEELLKKFQQFKNVSQSMSREEILQNAENLAEIFVKMLNEE